jgi:oligopeptide/dipeptide ABC transporter ATP-binding protein
MPVVWSDSCRLHEPAGEIWIGVRTPGTETAARADAILAGLAEEEPRIVTAEQHADADDLSTAARFADRIAVMYLGRIVEEGPASEVVRNPQHPYTKALLSVVPRRDPRLRRRPQILRGETPDAVRIPSGCRFHPRCPIAIDACTAEDPSLKRPDGTKSPHHRAACLLA